jgi:hypothetical protein
MYAFAQKSGAHLFMEKIVVHFYVKNFVTTRSLHDSKDQVFIVDVVGIDPMGEIMVSNVISRLVNVVAKCNAIIKICKYRRLHEKHHFVPMPMEIQNIFGRDMDRFIKECACFFHDRQSRAFIFVFWHPIFQATCYFCSSPCFNLFYKEENYVSG